MKENTTRGSHLPPSTQGYKDYYDAGDSYEESYVQGSSAGSHSRNSDSERVKPPVKRTAGKALKSQNFAWSKVMFILRTLLIDIAIGGVAICIFALFHHVIPTLQTRGTVVESISKIESAEETSAIGEESSQSETEGDGLSSESENAEETEAVDNRTEWQIKFADKFTDEVVLTDTSYSSPDISINITSDVYQDSYGRPTTVYVADIYVGSIDCFRTYFAGGQYISSKTDSIDNMEVESGAILAVNGDFANLYTNQGTFLTRNGEVFFTGKAYCCDICVLNLDGTMDVYEQNDFNATAVEDIIAKQPYNSWRFGPSLLDAEGHAKDNMNVTSDAVKYVNPRCAIGYYEPGHYCLLVCDGRSDESRGLSIWELASYFENLGCTAAYNLDGGGSAMMRFNGKDVNIFAEDWRTNEDRLIGDIVLIGEPTE